MEFSVLIRIGLCAGTDYSLVAGRMRFKKYVVSNLMYLVIIPTAAK